MSTPTLGERLAVVEEQVKALPRIEAQVADIWAYVNQQKGRDNLGKYIIPGAAMLVALAAFVRG